MSSKSPPSPAPVAAGASAQQNPADIAREAFRQLATRRIAPTPNAYRDIYNEIAGLPAEPDSQPGALIAASAPVDSGAENVLTRFAAKMSESKGELGEYGRRFQSALKARDWDAYVRNLVQLSERQGKKGGIDIAPLPDGEQTRTLRDLLSRTLSFAVATLLTGTPALMAESESLGAAIKLAHTEEALNDAALRLKQLCYQIELKSGDTAEQQELLLRLFKLLLENVSELLDDDSWLRGQIDAVQNLIAGPLDQRALEDATRSLKEVIYKQSQLKHSLSDVKLTVKNMMMTFIDRLGQVATSTGDFHEKIGGYSEKISQAENISELNQVLDDVLRETRLVQTEALRARDKMMLARQEVQDAEQRIHTLEAKLQHMSELVREDQLTGSLNRRGLDDVFERETARSDRRGTPLCIAMLDLDDFKRLNDKYGHLAGDAALKHLVKIVKETLRSMDVIARFGGEEFLILLPETTVDAASATMTRLQRELTKHFFLHDNEKVLITFSAGVALRHAHEDQAALVKRADRAMYQAKQTGKNRVVVAD
ncbi:GGDEF domain-containing protein [Janthinobacterium agaricidamnosum]|uniref:diguanylate cyclase n=1 Tax=Janthinobacterium agaricidamnosum NBRC 102515 = DSM 9628 TaxID=1349767 RepID=W0V2U6_9BURK|nr:GGDEF domain-containing protein [Janthinobacterium agaricidamnosum]CDG81915.1 diguanylate cyclase domain protein [Janthinobacterium agaricidamnosum NBRC 102515 = DSM 9628]